MFQSVVARSAKLTVGREGPAVKYVLYSGEQQGMAQSSTAHGLKTGVAEGLQKDCIAT